jgi:HPt (histidine-containing phosphotransfer) domain-containing protein
LKRIEKRGRRMTVQECYESIKGDYEGVKGRLLTDERIQKYLVKFSNATDYQQMVDAINQEDYELAFRMSHNLKGVSLNLGITQLQKTSEVLCEEFRNGKPKNDITGLLDAVTDEYNRTIDAIRSL